MRSPLTVRVDDGRVTRMVTRHASGLQFRKTAPGGHHSASVRLTLPTGTFDDLGPNDKLYVYDGRTGKTVWEGYTENPGRQDGAQGEAFDLSAMGGQVLAADMSTPVIFIDGTVTDDLWARVENVTPGATNSVVDGDLYLQFPSGIPVGTDSRVVMQYQGLRRSGQTLYSTGATALSGKVDTGYQSRIVTRQYDSAGTEVANSVVDTEYLNGATPVTMFAELGTFPAGRNTCEYLLIRGGGATNVADDATWVKFADLHVRPVLVDASGNAVLSGFAAGVLYSHEVVKHLLGAMLPVFDGPGALVEATSHGIQQLAYHDGATPRRVLDDLALFEPDHLWEVLETNAAGRHRFNFRAWPTEPRYEISVRDGYSAPGGEADLCNRISVYWTDVEGARQSTVVTSSVPALGSRVRDAQPVTLPQGVGSAADAQRVGERVLASKAAPPKAAKATVARPILDRGTGALVMPWEIEPGYVVRVRETGDDLRLTEVSFVDDRVSADLTLDVPQRTVEQMIATLVAAR